MLKADYWIREQALEHEMITPFMDHLVRISPDDKKVISFGVSAYGYDCRLADEYRVFTNAYGNIIVDPKRFDENAFVTVKDQGYCIIPPNSFVLARTVEYFKMPRNVTGLVTCKSTYARCGITSPSTVLESDWEGHITLEIANQTPLPAKVYSNEGIIQVLFFQSDEQCEVSYADRQGKYQGQTGITLAKV